MAYQYSWLTEQSAEDALHAERLLHIEERPFVRVTKRLLGEDSLLRATPKQLLSPPPESDDNSPLAEVNDADNSKRQKFREDILVDFAALESSITRIQLIQSSNDRERERYAAEKAKILATAQSVRENTLQLREHLVEAQKVLQLRKGYDELAAKIIDDRKLKSREEARSEIEVLEKEIEELEAEGLEVEGLWAGRREAFDRVVAEGATMIRVIKGIKDQPDDDMKEADEDEVMEGGEDGSKGLSRVGTPGVEDGRTPRIDTGSGTPLPENAETGDVIPDEGLQRRLGQLLEVENATKSNSAVASPAAAPSVPSDDVDMIGTSLTEDGANTEASQHTITIETEVDTNEDPSQEGAGQMDEM